MYGPGEHLDEMHSHGLGALIKKFVDAKRKSEPHIIMWGSGKPIREWLYVDDAAEAIIKSLDIKFTIEPINIGVYKGLSMLELAQMIKEMVDYGGDIILDKSKPDGVACKMMVNDRMKAIFNWEPPTGLREGIKKTAKWYQSLPD